MFGSDTEEEQKSGHSALPEGAFDSETVAKMDEKDASIDWKSILTGHEDVLFSCSGVEEDRELILTENRIIVRNKSKGSSFPINGCSVSFGKRDGSFRLSVTSSSRGYGLMLEKSDFEEFWRIFSFKLKEQ